MIVKALVALWLIGVALLLVRAYRKIIVRAK